MKILRQGDVLLKEIKKIPKNAVEKDNVLAYGEVTGHSHRINAKVFQSNGQQYVVCEKPCKLIHEEHAKLEVPEGKYQVVIQREFDILKGIRQVMD